MKCNVTRSLSSNQHTICGLEWRAYILAGPCGKKANGKLHSGTILNSKISEIIQVILATLSRQLDKRWELSYKMQGSSGFWFMPMTNFKRSSTIGRRTVAPGRWLLHHVWLTNSPLRIWERKWWVNSFAKRIYEVLCNGFAVITGHEHRLEKNSQLTLRKRWYTPGRSGSPSNY